jgi:hypothetical protein
MKTLFIPTMPDNTNVEHQVTLTEGQISTILYVMEGYILDNDEYEDRFKERVDQIFDILEGAVDEWYELYEPTSESSDEPTYVVK